MSLTQDITRISVQGQKESIVRMLNAVLTNLETGKQIAEDDSLETANQKINDDSNGYAYRIRIPDLLEAEMLQRPEILKKMAEFNLSDEEPYIDYFTERAIDLLLVRQSGNDYTIDFELYECESSCYVDYIWWGDIVRLYGCRVFVDNDLYRNGSFANYCGAFIYEPGKDGVKRTEIRPKLDILEYTIKFDDLIRINPERYRPLKIKYFKDKIARLQNEVGREEACLEREHLSSEFGVNVDKYIWEDFFIAETKGPKSVREIFDWYMSGTTSGRREVMSPKELESMGITLELRLKKWRGVDEDFADVYDSILTEFQNVVDTKIAEYEQHEKDMKEQERLRHIERCKERHNEFLLRSAMVEPEVRSITDWNGNEEEEEIFIGYEYRYYIGEQIDDVEYLNEYCVSRNDEYYPGKLCIDLVCTSRKLDAPYVDRLCSCTLLMPEDQPVVFESMNKSAFFDLLNSNASQDVEPLSKETPMIFTSASDYERRFKELGFEIIYIRDYVKKDDLPF